MLKLKKMPKHISLSIDRRFNGIISDSTKFKRKGAHTVEKYDPRRYLIEFAKEVKVNTPLFYDYQIRIQNPSLTIHRYTKSKGLTQALLRTQYTNKSNNETHNPLQENFDKKYNKLSSSLYSNRKFIDQSIRYDKEKSRRKWNKLLKRTIFNFDINNDTVSLIRVKRPDIEDDTIDHVKVRTKQEELNLSPHLQKKKGIEDRAGRNSIKVYYEIGNKSLSKTLGFVDPTVERHAKEMIFKSKVKNNLKFECKLRNLIRREPLETNFDLTKIDLTQIDPTSYLHLYLAIKKAVTPTFYCTENEKLNELDTEVVEAIQNKPETKLTEHDNNIIALYKNYIHKANIEEIISGFWQTKKVKGYRPPCRESASLISLADKLYLFGGYGVDRMNDLWSLTIENDFLAEYTWSNIRPLGNKIPDKRYGHCMATYNNYIYIFGGSSDFITGLKMRIVLGDIWKYSVEDNRWEELNTSTRTYKSRMYAASGALEEMWIIHGGTDGSPQNILSSTIAYSFRNVNNKTYRNGKSHRISNRQKHETRGQNRSISNA